MITITAWKVKYSRNKFSALYRLCIWVLQALKDMVIAVVHIIKSLTFEDTMIANQILASSTPGSNSAFQEMPGFPLRYYAEPLFVSMRLLWSGRTDSFKEAAAVVSATATGPSLSLVWRTTGQKCYCQMWGNMFYM